MTHINLWEALTTLESRHARGEYISPKVTEEDIIALGTAGRWNGQELSLEASEEGWIIKVFSCYSEDFVTEVKILIPKDLNKPVKILKDRSGRVEFHHD